MTIPEQNLVHGNLKGLQERVCLKRPILILLFIFFLSCFFDLFSQQYHCVDNDCKENHPADYCESKSGTFHYCHLLK